MPLTFNGFGTMYYGEADRRDDGSAITTEWITAAYVPLIPLRSFRLVQSQGEEVGLMGLHSESYHVVEKLGIFWPQVFRIYLFLAFVAVWWASAIWICFTNFDIGTDVRAPWIISIWVLAMALPFFLVWWMRREAYRSKADARRL